ncbi:glycoside hydrolase family protein [Catellatospora sichuanensis]|uniref:glycoside hydrolase family protein n=1 Tax=Catellatospora sichuanensis TaxID=1969805 RepID=UPI001FE34659|nr:glycoside hydrolase family protein [Catellatospora sichuanensis]
MDETSQRQPGRHVRRDSRKLWLAVALTVAVLIGGSFAAVRLWSDGPGAQAAGPGEPAAVTQGAVDPAASETASAGPSASASATPRPSVSASPRSQPGGPAKTSAKKGATVWDFGGLKAALTDVRASWYYNWSSGPSRDAGTSAAFVPMIWGEKSVTDAELARAKRSGKVLLGFNEPDFASQSNMTVERALDLWPRLQATGLRLGSPAVAVGADKAGGWLDRFLSGAKARGHRVDFITLHWYGADFSSAAVGHLKNYLQAVYQRYRMPIWVTEYALIKWGANGAVYPSDAQQAAFVTGSTRMMEGLSYVERYAWFALPWPTEGHQGTALYRDGDSPTAAGRAYRAAG